MYGIALRHRKWNSQGHSSFYISTNLHIFKEINLENITNISFINTNIHNVKTIYEKFKNSKTLVYLKVILSDLKYCVFTENLLKKILDNENIENIIIEFDWKEENFLINKRNSIKKYKCWVTKHQYRSSHPS
ncbi:11312_t:CDS:2 [Dentiscutata heterogama]|uniref:11312_t:CDS:1 n=1 Tax=Dentiscutata heterogama TaxID=1316150 RepID=A0ACA9LUK3_9GLOM|nr:11312_t:CDS:2 [Dentiscutata heterogama]